MRGNVHHALEEAGGCLVDAVDGTALTQIGLHLIRFERRVTQQRLHER